MKPNRLGIGLLLAAVVLCLPQPGEAGMIRFVGIWEMPADKAILDRWYYRTHSQETLQRVGPWLERYWTYRAYDVGPEADTFTVSRYRLTELWYASVEARNEAVVNFANMSPPPKGWDDPRYKTINGMINIPANPTDTFLGKQPPARERPYLRWMVLVKYPSEVPVDEGEQWYREVHAKELLTVPGLLRFVSYSSVDAPSKAMPWVRLSELWFDDYDDWRKAFVESPIEFTAPSWSNEFPFVDNICTFVGDEPDIDWLQTTPRIP